jgi:hypothetical protein
MRIDPNGMDDIPVDENGNFKRDKDGNLQIIKTDQPHRLAVDTKGKDGNITQQYYTLADQENDYNDIKNGTINKVVSVNKEQINQMLKNSGATNPVNGIPGVNLLYMNNNSDKKDNLSGTEYGKLDFSFRGIPQMFDKQGAVSNPNNYPSPLLFIPEGDTHAHNQMNFGNFMWGAAANSLNVPLGTALTAAHINSRKTTGEWDSKDDQLSITLGWQYRQRTR